MLVWVSEQVSGLGLQPLLLKPCDIRWESRQVKRAPMGCMSSLPDPHFILTCTACHVRDSWWETLGEEKSLSSSDAHNSAVRQTIASPSFCICIKEAWRMQMSCLRWHTWKADKAASSLNSLFPIPCYFLLFLIFSNFIYFFRLCIYFSSLFLLVGG